MSADTTYRLAVKPTTATNVSLYSFSVNAAAIMAAFVGGTQWYQSTRTDAGAWTDSTTNCPFIGLHLSQLDDGAGAASTIVVQTVQPVVLHSPKVVGY